MMHEAKVRQYYDDAGPCFEDVMGDVWHFGDPAAEARGVSTREAALILEDRLVAATGLRRDGWALDFGSGVGGGALHMAEVSGARFIGVTNNEVINRRARARSQAAGMTERVSFATIGDTDYRCLPFASASFDAVFFYESVCHLSDKPAAFREFARVLKPGGRLAGIDWLRRPFAARVSEAAIAEFMTPVDEAFRIPGHGTIEEYAAMAAEAGLRVVTAEDLYPGVICRGSQPPEHHEGFQSYAGAEHDLMLRGKLALDAARLAGVFTVGMIVAEKPAAGQPPAELR